MTAPSPDTTVDRTLRELEPIFRDILDLPDLVLTPGLSAKDLEEWDSLNHVRILSATESEYGIRFTAAEIEALASVGEFARLVADKRAARATEAR